jgi:hypothetical protein
MYVITKQSFSYYAELKELGFKNTKYYFLEITANIIGFSDAHYKNETKGNIF